MDSILQKEKRCLVCGTQYNLMIHHVFFGTGKRALSDKYGLTVMLCGHHHNLSREGVHQNKELDNEIKAMAQRKAMEHYGWSEEDFIKIFRRNYL